MHKCVRVCVHARTFSPVYYFCPINFRSWSCLLLFYYLQLLVVRVTHPFFLSPLSIPLCFFTTSLLLPFYAAVSHLWCHQHVINKPPSCRLLLPSFPELLCCCSGCCLHLLFSYLHFFSSSWMSISHVTVTVPISLRHSAITQGCCYREQKRTG